MTWTICLSVLIASQLAAAAPAQERLHIGKFQSRAIWTPGKTGAAKAPVVILVPGSGAHGPEEMMTAGSTLDGKEHSLFAEMAQPLNEAGVHTLQLGKPGVEFFSSWDPAKRFYDLPMVQNSTWQDYLDNVAEAIRYLAQRPEVDPQQIWILGHSEGTQVAIDVAGLHPEVHGLLLLGFSGSSIGSILDWQLYRRPIDEFIRPDVDKDHDGFVSRAEAASWPDLQYKWKPGQDKASYAELEGDLRADPQLQAVVTQAKSVPLYSNGIFDRAPMYEAAASLKQPLILFTGTLDVQTPPREAQSLKDACDKKGKVNCSVTFVPGVGHGFSAPRGPRCQKLLDATLGPIAPELQQLLRGLNLPKASGGMS
jgi:pimeloyl-ACP methyl ester carboxylesterase